jgi:NADH dehydrogenase FAD-containing subunit
MLDILDIFKVNYYDNNKKNIILLGDGFFARGFLHTINRKKFNIYQIYRESFINPQDMIYSLQRNDIYSPETKQTYHFRDFFYKSPNYSLKLDIKKLEISLNKLYINDIPNHLSFDYLVIGLGAQKSLKQWSDEFNLLCNKKDLNIGIVGMGPIGIELGLILSKNNKIDMFDMLDKQNILNYVKQRSKNYILNLLDKKNISTTYGVMYDKTKYIHDVSIFCVGTRANNLTSNFKVNNFLQHIDYSNVYIGGDCINSISYIKTAQMAYQQGIYVADRLNREIENKENSKEFEYEHNGMSLNLGDKKVLIENSKHIKYGIYPDFIIKLYSMFFI